MREGPGTRIDASVVALAASVALASATPVAGRQADSTEQPAAIRPPPNANSMARRDPAEPAERPELFFEREVFVYPAEDRRNPFRPLGSESMGPVFEALSLRLILFSEAPGESLIVLADGSGKSHRLRRGERLGNTILVSIAPKRAVFVVEDYGNRRREVLELRADTGSEGG